MSDTSLEVIALTTCDEMTPDQWDKFKAMWLDERAEDLKRECGIPAAEVKELAAYDFEEYLNCEGYIRRDMRIRELRGEGPK